VIGTKSSLPALQQAAQNALRKKQSDVEEAANLAVASINRRS
jgi:hypothetical protein